MADKVSPRTLGGSAWATRAIARGGCWLCYAGGESINDRLVREGWELDYRKYSTDYLEAEAEAKRGCWWRSSGCVRAMGDGIPRAINNDDV